MPRTRTKDFDLPKGIYRHGRKYRQLLIVDGKRVWRPLDSVTLAEESQKDPSIGTRTHLFTGGMSYGKFVAMIARTKHGAAARGLRFDLTEIDVNNLIKRASGRCEVSRIPFRYSKQNPQWSRNPWGPSIDRIDSRQGYFFDNCRLVCLAVNTALNEWGDDVLLAVAKGVCDAKNITNGNIFDGAW